MADSPPVFFLCQGAVNPSSFSAQLLGPGGNEAAVDLGTHGHLVISYDESNKVSVHHGAAWGLDGDFRRPVLLYTFNGPADAMSFWPAKSWACPEVECFVGISVCSFNADNAVVIASKSTISTLDAETVALDGCASHGRRLSSSATISTPPMELEARDNAVGASATDRVSSVGQEQEASVSMREGPADPAASLPPIGDGDGDGSTAVDSDVMEFECTFVCTLCEDHFDTQQHFRYGACAPPGAPLRPFGQGVAHLVNLADSFHSGDHLRLRVRAAGDGDVPSWQSGEPRRRALAADESAAGPVGGAATKHEPTWMHTRHAFRVEAVLDWRKANLTDEGSTPGGSGEARRLAGGERALDGSTRGDGHARALSSTDRTILTICTRAHLQPALARSCL